MDYTISRAENLDLFYVCFTTLASLIVHFLREAEGCGGINLCQILPQITN